MLVALPLLCFALLVHAVRRRSPCADPRAAVLWAALAWGVLTVTLTELLSLFGALSATTVALGWGTAASGLVVLTARQGGLDRLSLARPPRQRHLHQPQRLSPPHPFPQRQPRARPRALAYPSSSPVAS